MKRFFYFRPEATIEDDDAQADSVMVPVEDITGMNAQAATKLDIFFKPQASLAGGISGARVNDFVRLTVTTETQKGVMKAITQAMNSGPHHDGITVIADDVKSNYLVKEITACDSFSAGGAIS
tara:strand:- start:4 stop:372 length:369 start_codon:yes stop_codon:yes gene_type:complete